MAKPQNIPDAVFENPVRSNIVWTDIEKMLVSLGAKLSEGRGSRVRIALGDVRAVFHRPHPQKETDKGAVSMRRFLAEAGFAPRWGGELEAEEETDGLEEENS